MLEGALKICRVLIECFIILKWSNFKFIWQDKLDLLTLEFRNTFELNEDEHKSFVETTKTQVLEGTSKWSAKIAIKGWFCCSAVVKLNVVNRG